MLAANGVRVLIDSRDGYTPTPVALARDPRPQPGRATDDPARADGIVVTPSHNPPRDGGFKYNPPDGGPAGSDITGVDPGPGQRVPRRPPRRRAPDPAGTSARRRTPRGGTTSSRQYVDDLPGVIDLDAIRVAGIRIGVDPLGGASVAYWGAIADRHHLDLTVVNPLVDPAWRFMTLD